MHITEALKVLLNAVISPTESGQETATWRRAIAYAILSGMLQAVANAVESAKELRLTLGGLAKHLPQLNDFSPCENALTTFLAETRKSLEAELGKESAEKALAVLEQRAREWLRKSPADILPAEMARMLYTLGYRIGMVFLGLDAMKRYESPSRI